MVGFVNLLTKDAIVAEDIGAETFIKLYLLRNKFDTVVHVKAFVFITAGNAAIDYLRHQKRQQNILADISFLKNQEAAQLHGGEYKVNDELLRMVRDEIEKLPVAFKAIFKISYLEDMSIDEIIEKTGLSYQTVVNQRHNAVKKIKRALFGKGL